MGSSDETVAHRRVISFSLYGDAPLYTAGAVENARLTPVYYPGWTARFYIGQEISDPLVNELRSHGAETERMSRDDFRDGMLWRLLAADDHRLDAVIFRDVDSRFSERETAAVTAWLDSGRQFHLMRDHPFHSWPIMGGMWGVLPGALPPVRSLIRNWRLKRRLLGYELGLASHDQMFLRAEAYPIARSDALIHSEFVSFEGETPHPFPQPARPGEFVGQVVAADGTPRARGARHRAAHPGLVEYGPVRRYDPASRALRLARRLLPGGRRASIPG